jgi:hypothetical protein
MELNRLVIIRAVQEWMDKRLAPPVVVSNVTYDNLDDLFVIEVEVPSAPKEEK